MGDIYVFQDFSGNRGTINLGESISSKNYIGATDKEQTKKDRIVIPVESNFAKLRKAKADEGKPKPPPPPPEYDEAGKKKRKSRAGTDNLTWLGDFFLVRVLALCSTVYLETYPTMLDNAQTAFRKAHGSKVPMPKDEDLLKKSDIAWECIAYAKEVLPFYTKMYAPVQDILDARLAQRIDRQYKYAEFQRIDQQIRLAALEFVSNPAQKILRSKYNLVVRMAKGHKRNMALSTRKIAPPEKSGQLHKLKPII